MARPLGQQSQDLVGAQEAHTTFVDIFRLLFSPRWSYKISAISAPSKKSAHIGWTHFFEIEMQVSWRRLHQKHIGGKRIPKLLLDKHVR